MKPTVEELRKQLQKAVRVIRLGEDGTLPAAQAVASAAGIAAEFANTVESGNVDYATGQ